MRSRAVLTLGVVTVAAVVLRAVRLDSGLWIDEIETLVDFARKPLFRIVTEYGRNDHPLNTLLAHASLAVFGEHPWSLRLPAMLFGVACIPMVYALGKFISSTREGLLAACVLAVSYHHIWFSQSARGYTALAFWGMLSSLLLLRGLQGAHRGWFVAYGLVAALGIYTHLAMGFVILAHLAGWLWLRRDWRQAAIGFGIAGIGTVLLYAPMAAQTYAAARAPNYLQGVATPQWAIRQTFEVLGTGFGSWGVLVSAILLGLGLWDYWRTPWTVVTFVVLPVVLTAVALVALKQPIHPRFFFFLIGFAALFVVRGATIAGSWMGRPAIGTLLAGVVMLASALSLGALYRYPKQDFEGALRYVEAHRGIGDEIVAAGVARGPYRDYFGKPWTMVRTPEEILRVRATVQKVWVVYSMPQYMNDRLADWLRAECRTPQVFQGTLSGGEVVVCAL